MKFNLIIPSDEVDYCSPYVQAFLKAFVELSDKAEFSIEVVNTRPEVPYGLRPKPHLEYWKNGQMGSSIGIEAYPPDQMFDMLKEDIAMVLVQCHDCGFQLLPEGETVLQERWIPHSGATGDQKEIPLGAHSAWVRVCKDRGDCSRRTLDKVAGSQSHRR